MNSFFPISSESYEAIDIWLDLLEEFDDNYKREKKIFYKSKRIQEKAYSKKEVVDVKSLTSSNFSLSTSLIDKNRFNSEIDEVHSIELVSRVVNNKKLSLFESLENLSETIEDISDDDEDDYIFDMII